MKMKTLVILAIGGILGGTAIAQQSAAPTSPSAPSSAAPPPNSSTPPPADDKPAGPSADTLRKAKNAGFHVKTKSGQTVFCKSETEIGSHFTEEKCFGEAQMLLVLDRQQQQRDSLGNHACGAGGGSCGGK